MLIWIVEQKYTKKRKKERRILRLNGHYSSGFTVIDEDYDNWDEDDQRGDDFDHVSSQI